MNAIKGRYFVGKVSRNLDKTGSRNCHVYVTWELSVDGRFSMQGEIWNHIKSDIIMGGQCIDTLADLFPHNKKLQAMRAIWIRWHLNDMRAGNSTQEAYLRACPVGATVYPDSHYSKASEALALAGLNPDQVTGYKYGSAWCVEELPPNVISEILGWSITKED